MGGYRKAKNMTQIRDTKDMAVLQSLMEFNHSPLLIQVLFLLAGRGGFEILEAYHPTKNTRLPVSEIILNPDYYPGAKLYRIVEDINNAWQYDKMKSKSVAEVIDDKREKRFKLVIRTCEETIRRFL
jgi:hypothetical protein